jgi:hypothetical protein
MQNRIPSAASEIKEQNCVYPAAQADKCSRSSLMCDLSNYNAASKLKPRAKHTPQRIPAGP